MTKQIPRRRGFLFDAGRLVDPLILEIKNPAGAGLKYRLVVVIIT